MNKYFNVLIFYNSQMLHSLKKLQAIPSWELALKAEDGRWHCGLGASGSATQVYTFLLLIFFP